MRNCIAYFGGGKVELEKCRHFLDPFATTQEELKENVDFGDRQCRQLIVEQKEIREQDKVVSLSEEKQQEINDNKCHYEQ